MLRSTSEDNTPLWLRELRLKKRNKTLNQRRPQQENEAEETSSSDSTTTAADTATSEPPTVQQPHREVEASSSRERIALASPTLECNDNNSSPKMVQERPRVDRLVGDVDSDEELKYGPGIVSKLKDRYLSLTLREATVKTRPSILHLRRATSLEHILDDYEEKIHHQDERKEEDRLFERREVSNSSRKSRYNRAAGRSDMKRARSVEIISSSSSSSSSEREPSGLVIVAGNDTTARPHPNSIREPTEEAKNEHSSDNRHPARTNRPLKIQPIMSEKEKPPHPDNVKEKKKLFERAKLRTKSPTTTGDVAAKVAEFKTIIDSNKKPPIKQKPTVEKIKRSARRTPPPSIGHSPQPPKRPPPIPDVSNVQSPIEEMNGAIGLSPKPDLLQHDVITKAEQIREFLKAEKEHGIVQEKNRINLEKNSVIYSFGSPTKIKDHLPRVKKPDPPIRPRENGIAPLDIHKESSHQMSESVDSSKTIADESSSTKPSPVKTVTKAEKDIPINGDSLNVKKETPPRSTMILEKRKSPPDAEKEIPSNRDSLNVKNETSPRSPMNLEKRQSPPVTKTITKTEKDIPINGDSPETPPKSSKKSTINLEKRQSPPVTKSKIATSEDSRSNFERSESPTVKKTITKSDVNYENQSPPDTKTITKSEIAIDDTSFIVDNKSNFEKASQSPPITEITNDDSLNFKKQSSTKKPSPSATNSITNDNSLNIKDQLPSFERNQSPPATKTITISEILRNDADSSIDINSSPFLRDENEIKIGKSEIDSVTDASNSDLWKIKDKSPSPTKITTTKAATDTKNNFHRNNQSQLPTNSSHSKIAIISDKSSANLVNNRENGAKEVPSFPKKTPSPKKRVQQQQNSFLFDFTSREDVPDYVGNDGYIKPKEKMRVKPGEGGIVRLPGATNLEIEEEDEDWRRLLECPPSPCNVTFTNDNVLMKGRSNIKKAKKPKMTIRFVDVHPEVYEYPSETSLIDDTNYANTNLNNTTSLGHTVPSLSGSTLANYTPKSAVQSEQFQLGVKPSPAPSELPPSRTTEETVTDRSEVLDEPVAFSAGTNSDILF